MATERPHTEVSKKNNRHIVRKLQQKTLIQHTVNHLHTSFVCQWMQESEKKRAFVEVRNQLACNSSVMGLTHKIPETAPPGLRTSKEMEPSSLLYSVSWVELWS